MYPNMQFLRNYFIYIYIYIALGEFHTDKSRIVLNDKGAVITRLKAQKRTSA